MDCQFTSFKKLELISIALICGEREFYRELNDFDPARCSAFAVEHVLPLLGAPAQRRSRKEVGKDLCRWIAELQVDCYFVFEAMSFDMPLISRLLDVWPARLSQTAVRFPVHDRTAWSQDRQQQRLIARMVEATYEAPMHGEPHHALNDARALAAAWKTARARGWRAPTIEFISFKRKD